MLPQLKVWYKGLHRFFVGTIFRTDLILSFTLGLFSALAMAPISFWLILFVTFSCLWFLLQKCMTTKQVFWIVWVFGFGYFTAGLYWIAAALFVDIASNWWVLPFAVMGLPAIMAFYPALALVLWHRLAWRGPARVILFIACWNFADHVRGWMFTGFPWNLWGYTWIDTPLIQSVSLWGIYGLTLLTLVLVFLPIFWWQETQKKSSRAFVIFVLLLLAFLIPWGVAREKAVIPSTDFRLRIVQPNIPQEAKWDEQQQLAHEEKLWRLTSQKTFSPPQMVIWPETAITLVGTNDVFRLENNLQQYLMPQTILAAGVLDVGWDDKNDVPTFFNRLAFYDGMGRRVGLYDKSHLVPFGEYLPFQEYWPVRPVAFQAGRFTAGTGVQTMQIQSVPSFSPLICYEVLFSGETASKLPRPAWILNITNDAWYGNSSGPYQHLVLTQVRAIEEGLPLVRVANTGISAVIDPTGRLVQTLPLNAEGVIDQFLPQALQPTLFARVGNIVFWSMLGFLLILGSIWQKGQRKKIRQI
jgi:apolipoprotein N-acyltransferase